MNKENLKPCMNDMCIENNKKYLYNCLLFLEKVKACEKYTPEKPQSALKECLIYINDILDGYDGYNTVKGLKSLIDEVKEEIKKELEG